VFSVNELSSERTHRISGADDRDRGRFAQTARSWNRMNVRVPLRRESLIDPGRLDGPFAAAARDVGVGDRGGGAEVEHRGQVQRVGPDGERFVQDAVAADLFKLDTAQ
jgi:hypothetical protein